MMFCDYCQRKREPSEALAVLYALMGQPDEAGRLEEAAAAGFVWACRTCHSVCTEPTEYEWVDAAHTRFRPVAA